MNKNLYYYSKDGPSEKYTLAESELPMSEPLTVFDLVLQVRGKEGGFTFKKPITCLSTVAR